MDIRYSCNQRDFKRYTTEETRREFLIETLFVPGKVTPVYSHVDRMVTVGIMPADKPLPIDDGIDVWHCFGTHYFLERREAGMFNVGGAGKVSVDGTVYELGYKDCLYITMGAKEVVFCSDDPANPAKFYMVSAFTLDSSRSASACTRAASRPLRLAIIMMMTPITKPTKHAKMGTRILFIYIKPPILKRT